MKKVYYWSPFITPVATVRAVINSANTLKVFSKLEYQPSIINVAGEWNIFKKELEDKEINLIELTSSNIINNKKYKGFLKSRLIYIYIFFLAFFPLIRLLKSNPPDFFIIHLISPLPMIINYFFKINTKMILRISGFPKLNIIRKLFWKITLSKIHLLTCPTKATKKDIELNNLVQNKKIKTLYDPIISPKNIIYSLKNSKINLEDRNYFLAIGRLTRQKNFTFLIDAFKTFNGKNKNKLIIVGEGEQKDALLKLIRSNKIENLVEIHDHTENIYHYYKHAKCFILSSLWEDPGFVLVEACYMGLPIISSDCKNGPEEILEYGKNGILFENNKKNSFIKKVKLFENLSKDEIRVLIVNAKKKSREFTLLKHYKNLIILLKEID